MPGPRITKGRAAAAARYDAALQAASARKRGPYGTKAERAERKARIAAVLDAEAEAKARASALAHTEGLRCYEEQLARDAETLAAWEARHKIQLK